MPGGQVGGSSNRPTHRPLEGAEERRMWSRFTKACGVTTVEAAVPRVIAQKLLLFLHLELRLLNEWCQVRDHGVVILHLQRQMALFSIHLHCTHLPTVAGREHVMGKQFKG